MKKYLTTTLAIAASHAALGVSAHAADLGSRRAAPYYTPPAYVAPLYNWTGFYVGAHLGGAFSSDSNFSGLGTGSNGNGRFLGGLQAGRIGSSLTTGWSASKASTAGSPAVSARCSPAALPTPTTSAGLAR